MSVKWALRSGFMPKVSMLGSRARGLPGRPGPASTSQSHVGLELESGSQHCRTVPSRCASRSSSVPEFPWKSPLVYELGLGERVVSEEGR